MHATERERAILDAMDAHGFVSYRVLEARLDASPATIRRDLARMARTGSIHRIRGGAQLIGERPAGESGGGEPRFSLAGTPFAQAINQRREQKEAIGRAAAALCRPGEGVIIDGGTTTFQMCPHLAGLRLQVLTNSLHIVSALLPQEGTQLMVPSGAVFREQNIILAPAGEESLPRFHATTFFMGCAAVGARGVMQSDVILVAAERRLLGNADRLVLLADSWKFSRTSGAVVCALDQVDTLITDDGLDAASRRMIEAAGTRIIIA